jgi:hypothetical protein
VVLVSHSTPAIARTMAALSQTGTRTLAIFITPNGAAPEETAKLGGPELEVRTVSPYNWVEMLDRL